jgi:hypothetical protein
MQAEEVIRSDWPGVIFFLSYGRPVAYKAQDNSFVQIPKWSPTTTRQTNRWIRETMEQFYIVACTPTTISSAEMKERFHSFENAEHAMDSL